MSWKTVAVAALVVLLVLIGIPLLLPGMGRAICHDCGPAVSPGHSCAALAAVASVALALALMSVRVRVRRDQYSCLVRSLDLDRPPQLA